MKVTFREIRVGRRHRRGWLVCFDGSMVAVLGQREGAGPDDDVFCEHATIQPFASLWATAWSSLDLAKEDFREVGRLYARGIGDEEADEKMRAWRPAHGFGR